MFETEQIIFCQKKHDLARRRSSRTAHVEAKVCVRQAAVAVGDDAKGRIQLPSFETLFLLESVGCCLTGQQPQPWTSENDAFTVSLSEQLCKVSQLQSQGKKV